MNTEQKAKAYDETLEKARKVYSNISSGYSNLKKILENAFPELKESEDERIRKAIIEYFESCNIKHLDWIAWLEKQGEPKPAGKCR